MVRVPDGWLFPLSWICILESLQDGASAAGSMHTSQHGNWPWQPLCAKAHIGVLVHSDRESYYTRVAFHTQLADNTSVQSMCRKGGCCDNAAMEGFFGTIERELVHLRHYKNRRSANKISFNGLRLDTTGTCVIRFWDAKAQSNSSKKITSSMVENEPPNRIGRVDGGKS